MSRKDFGPEPAVGYLLRPVLSVEMDSGGIAAFRRQNESFGGLAAEDGGGFRREQEVEGVGHTVHKLGVVELACGLIVSKQAANGRCSVEVVRRSECIGIHMHDVAAALVAVKSSRSQAGHNLWDVEVALSEHTLPCVALSNTGHLPSALLSQREYFVARERSTRDTCLFAGECGVDLDHS